MIRRVPRDWWIRPKPIRDEEWPASATAADRDDPVFQDLMRRHGYSYVAELLRDRRRAEKEKTSEATSG